MRNFTAKRETLPIPVINAILTGTHPTEREPDEDWLNLCGTTAHALWQKPQPLILVAK